MAADMKNPPKNNSSLALTLWYNKMKKAQTQGDGLERALMQKKTAKKVVTVESDNSLEKIMAENNNNNNNNKGDYRTSKKTCICAPTKHAGSFRCHHHRMKVSPQDRSDKKSKCENFNSKTTAPANIGDGQPRLSRFGRTAACKNLPLTMLSSKPEKVK